MLHYKTQSEVYERDFYSHLFANPVRHIGQKISADDS